MSILENEDAKDAAAIIETVAKLQEENFVDITHPATGDTVPVAVLPSGRGLHSLKKLFDEYAVAPDRSEGVARMTTLASFIEHAKRSKLSESVIFADDGKQPALVAVYDYDDPTNAEHDPVPGFMKHRARYDFPLSDEWQAWTAGAGKWFAMAEFAEFIEDRLVDVILPEEGQDSIKEFAARLELTLATPRQLMELSRGLKVNVDMRVENAQNLQSGESRLIFTVENKDGEGRPLKVPGGFALSIPVFRGGDKFDVPVLLRYRVNGGKVVWSFSLYRTDLIMRKVVAEAADKAHAETGLELFFGQPER